MNCSKLATAMLSWLQFVLASSELVYNISISYLLRHRNSLIVVKQVIKLFVKMSWY